MKTILITGSTDGIGKLVAIKLAKDGHQIFLHGRNPEKLKNVIEEVKQTSNNQNIDGFVADFSDLKAVSAMADEVNEKLSKLDVLINNAGIFKSTATTKYGDIRMVVNYLAPYLLTKKTITLLEKSNNARIVNLSSAAQSPVDVNAISGAEIFNVSAAYAQSKLALTMWSFDLAEKLVDTTVIAVNPGSLLNTRMANEAYGQHWSPADKGGNILYDLAVSEEYKNSSGKYFDNDKGDPKGHFAPAHPDAYDVSKIENLIKTTETVLTKI